MILRVPQVFLERVNLWMFHIWHCSATACRALRAPDAVVDMLETHSRQVTDIPLAQEIFAIIDFLRTTGLRNHHSRGSRFNFRG